MEFLALHKIVLLTVTFCQISMPNGYRVEDACANRIVKKTELVCEINKDDFEICASKLRTTGEVLGGY